jgi:hypothetical protein
MNESDAISREELLSRSKLWATRLLHGPITFFPVRHHSPACATHLAAWIERVRPRSVIIEGATSFNRWLPALVDEQCRPPVAILTTYRDSADEEARHSAFYPLCEYSPEWIAIRHGTAIGAKVLFADAEFAEKIQLRDKETGEDPKPSSFDVSLVDESQWRHSQFIEALVRRMGCRDFDELWDHLFESRATMDDTSNFVGRLATYCDLSRRDYAGRLERDGTLAREAIMVNTIQAEWQRLNQPSERGSILVVTGGFHTVALAEQIEKFMSSGDTAKKGKISAINRSQNKREASEREGVEKGSKSWLVRYSYAQLDALNGYQSGMPSPGFYDALWRASKVETKLTNGKAVETRRQSLDHCDRVRELKRRTIAGMISQIARSTRGGSLPHEASVTDTIAAVTMLDQLAELRGHEVPTRTDMLDAITNSMRKESLTGRDELDQIIQRLLTGDSIGDVPRSAQQPPIVEEFRAQCERYRLPLNLIEPRLVTLEIYRKPAHRETSFFLQRLLFLGVPFAQWIDGPDFTNGYHLSKLSEEWQVVWSPSTEARLIQMSTYGDTVAGAAERLLVEEIRKQMASDSARDASFAVGKLLLTCRMGLHHLADHVFPLVEQQIAEDNRFFSMAEAASKLLLLDTAREPLESFRLANLNRLMVHCYQRACHLIDGLSNVPDDDVEASLDGLCSLRELVSQQTVHTFDRQLLVVALERLLQSGDPYPRGEIAGAAAGMLFSLGHMDEEQVCRVVQNHLDSACVDVGGACGAVRGLMTTARETFWRMPNLLTLIDSLFQDWDEDRFRVALPHLRLAFSQLTPKEIDAVAERVASLHEVSSLGNIHHPQISEEELHFGVALNRLMRQSLQEDGL